MADSVPSAAIATIGDEVLRGDTLDANKAFLGAELTRRGVDVRLAVTLPDRLDTIVEWVRRLSGEHDYLLLSGGIGPTPDDVTRPAVAAAFARKLDPHEEQLRAFELEHGVTLNWGQREMWRLPADCELLWGEGVRCPGFRVENVYAFAGVPLVLKAMWAYVADRFNGVPLHVVRFRATIGESRWAEAMARFVATYPQVEIGSYPKIEDCWYAEVTVRGRDLALVERVAGEFRNEIERIAAEQR